jgi:translocation and assembly module TamB
VTDGQYQNLSLGTILTDVRIETRLLEEGDLGVTLRANDGASGTVEARMLVLLGDGPVALDLTANADSAVLVRRDDVTAAVSVEAAVEGPLNELDVTGEILIDKAEVRLVNATPPSVVTLDGIRIAGEPEAERDEAGESVINLFLSIVAEDDIFVRGRGLDSEWRMDLAVTGTATQPVVSGTVQKVRGQLGLLGRTFQLARGRLVFDGGREIDPELDVYLQREDHGLRGGIVIEGTPSNPELSFTSTPALPEDEVMPRLLFGQSRQSLTGAQALQLAAGIATLTGTGGGGPIEALREAAGLDVLRVEGQSVEDAAVTVGRNVGEDVFVGAKQGLGEQGTTAVTVEVEVFDNVTVDAEVGEQGNSSVGISLKKDF